MNLKRHRLRVRDWKMRLKPNAKKWNKPDSCKKLKQRESERRSQSPKDLLKKLKPKGYSMNKLRLMKLRD